MKDIQQRPHNLNVGQEVSIWGDSPAPSPSESFWLQSTLNKLKNRCTVSVFGIYSSVS